MKNKLFLTESEKQRISGLHRRAIANESKNALNEADLTQIQQLLIDKKLMSPNLASGKTSADGRLGPLTLDALYSALTQTQNVVGDQGTSGTAGTSGVQGTSGTAGVAGTSGTAGVVGTSGTAGVAGTSGTAIKDSFLSASKSFVANGVAGTSGTAGVAGTSGTAGVAGTSATIIPGQPKSAQQIRQDYNQQKQNERQGARVVRKNKKELEKELKDLQTNYQRLQNKMTPEDKQSYELRIGQIQTDLGNF